MRVDLRAFLQDAGAPDDDIERAAAEGWLPLLTLDRTLLPGAAEYDLTSAERSVAALRRAVEA